MSTRPRPPQFGRSRLQRATAQQILALLHQRAAAPGVHLPEVELSKTLRVSRTPVRGALLLLAREGIVEFRPGRGFFVRRLVTAPPRPPAGAGGNDDDALSIAIARDRLTGKLDDECSESDLMRRYGVSRVVLTRVLRQLASVGMTERKRGHGWTFMSAPSASSAALDSYRFRMIIEPAALLEPQFALDGDWARSIRARHEQYRNGGVKRFSSVAFFEMNAEFHEQLARSSGNTQLYLAVAQQSKLRRFLNYDWVYGQRRVEDSVREHLAILDAIEAGDRALAAKLLRAHIEGAARLRGRR
jgi:DNA-binding GntR family transcriptional regulator